MEPRQFMTLELNPEDIEIEELTPGPIIHIFPKKDPYDAAEKILKGIFTLEEIQLILDDWDKTIKQKEQPEYIIMAFAELQRVLDEIQKNSEKRSLEIMEKVKKI